MNNSEWNFYYVAYSISNGKSPDAMLAEDLEKYPGGKMCGFMEWIRDRWNAWHSDRGLVRHEHILTDDDRDSFQRYVKEYSGMAEDSICF